MKCKLLAVVLVVALAVMETEGVIEAASFAVDSSVDAVDTSPGDGVCADSAGNCTLRAAVMEANALSGTDTIALPSGTFVLSIAGASENLAATGDIDITDHLTINGAGANTTILDGNSIDRVFHIVPSAGTVEISGVTIRNGSGSDGGGLRNGSTLTLNNSTVTNNSAGSSGGAIANTDGGSLTIADSIFSGNTAWDGGAIFNPDGGTVTISGSVFDANTASQNGGGIVTFQSTLTIDNSTFSGNNAATRDGGGIHGHEDFVNITNSTFSGNTAGRGGGAVSSWRSTVTIANSTFNGNTADFGGGGFFRSGSGTFSIKNTVIANNVPDDCLADPVSSLGHNLDGDGTCGLSDPTDLSEMDPLLGPLQDNGGLTQTHAPLPGSPVIDSGNPALPGTGGNACQASDQRGIVRPLDGNGDGTATCDMGAVEALVLHVDSSDDTDDGSCNASHCSLREAINAGNALVGSRDTVVFNIPGSGPHTIQPTSALPTFTDPIVIDGYTQPGSSPNTNGPGLGLNTVLKIELDGTNAGSGFVSGFHLSAANSIVRGLAINRFSGNGVWISGSGATGNSIEGNFLGTDITGSASLGNLADGVQIRSAEGNTVGGTEAEDRNVISGNNVRGISIQADVDTSGFDATGNLVLGNLIGTDASGTLPLGNSQEGVVVRGGRGNTIGGAQPGAGNIISGNRGGLWIRDIPSLGITGANDNIVEGNFIGTDVTGLVDVGNTSVGVDIIGGASNNSIGGTASGAGNRIAYNASVGVIIRSGTSNAVLSNTMFSNGSLGIDLTNISANDAGDGDSGPNNGQNSPHILSVQLGTDDRMAVRYSVDSDTSNSTYPLRIEFFKTDAEGEEGKTFLGSESYPADSARDAKVLFFVDASALGLVDGDHLVATATDGDNNTSEFSQSAQVVAIGTAAIPGLSQWGLTVLAVLMTAAVTWRIAFFRQIETPST